MSGSMMPPQGAMMQAPQQQPQAPQGPGGMGGIPPQLLMALLSQMQGRGGPPMQGQGPMGPQQPPMPPQGGMGQAMGPGMPQRPPGPPSQPIAPPSPGGMPNGPTTPNRMQNQQTTPAQLAAKGRMGDTMIGHLTPGEVAVPPQVQTPEVKQALENAFSQVGLKPQQFTAGSPFQSVNPTTGVPEYSLWASLLPIAGAVLGSVIAPGGGTAAGAAIGGAAGGAAGGLIDNQSALGVLASAAGGAAGGYLGAPAGEVAAGAAGAGSAMGTGAGAAATTGATDAATSAAGSGATNALMAAPISAGDSGLTAAATNAPAASGGAISATMAPAGSTAGIDTGGAVRALAPTGRTPFNAFDTGAAATGTTPAASSSGIKSTLQSAMPYLKSGTYAGMGAGLAGSLVPQPQQDPAKPPGFDKKLGSTNPQYGQLLGSNQANAPQFSGYNAFNSVAGPVPGYRFFPIGGA